MNESYKAQFAQDAQTRLNTQATRFGLRVAAGLSEQSDSLPDGVSERLRFAREQALLKARSARTAQVQAAPNTVVMGAGPSLVLGQSSTPRWQKFSTLFPLLLLVLGMWLIQQSHWYEQVLAAAELDTGLLSDKLPPAAYSDPGFKEYLSDEQE
ncbi:DUF3619 family protein [Paucibacter sp. Y2R2-4]|uniref:DUF3619 family protein n=1 Tax=Paucibacter sp. Y2R2-4 TaxID=2893553 RepID=UPI0021E37198|nr:DUF3619 family protein [Paucibacter sp. Y2R2-4]MCV2351769.1 DUF3619 family protein [Paucibacter sp. Y2R2-4]